MGPDEKAGEPQPRTRGTWQVARIMGVPVYLTTSWIIFAVVLVVAYGPYFGDGRSSAASVAIGLSIVGCLLASVLLHELGHATAARHYRVRVRGITLELLGGFTEMDADSPSPRAEALIALAGPAVSFVLAIGAFGVLPLTTRGSVLGDFVFQVAATNALVAVFNVLPGLPLDGGRALRAGIWRLTGDPYRADVAAGWAGRVVAAATLAAGIALYTLTSIFTAVSVILLMLVALTLWNGASEAITVAQVRRRLPEVRAGELARPLHLVPSGTPLAEALRQRDEVSAGYVTPAGRPVASTAADRVALGVADATGRVLALVNSTAAAGVPAARRPWVAVDTVARTVLATQRIGADATGLAVVQAVQANPGADLVVMVGEDVVGVLYVRDVVAMLESRGPVT
jgi:Zn-dependent protease